MTPAPPRQLKSGRWALTAAIGLGIGAFAILGVWRSPGVTPARAAVAVSVGDNFYDPATVSIQAGNTVVWTNEGTLLHTVTADDGSFNSSFDLMPGSEYTHLFTQPGTYAYSCLIHGAPQVGTIIVLGDTPAPTAAPTPPPATPTRAPTPRPTDDPNDSNTPTPTSSSSGSVTPTETREPAPTSQFSRTPTKSPRPSATVIATRVPGGGSGDDGGGPPILLISGGFLAVTLTVVGLFVYLSTRPEDTLKGPPRRRL